MLVYAGTIVAFFVNAKFRMPMLPALCLFAAVAIERITHWGMDRRWRPVAAAAVAATVLSVYCNTGPLGVSTDISHRQTLYTFVNALKAEERYDEALEAIARGLERWPRDAHLQALQGLMYLNTGAPSQALTAFDRSLALDSTNTLALANAAVAHARDGDIDAADSLLARALACAPRSPDILARAAEVATRKQDDLRAVALLSRALEHNPRRTDIAQFLLLVARRVGDREAEARAQRCLPAAVSD